MYAATHMESSAAAAAARKADVMSSSTVFDPICRGLAQELENRNGVCVPKRRKKSWRLIDFCFLSKWQREKVLIIGCRQTLLVVTIVHPKSTFSEIASLKRTFGYFSCHLKYVFNLSYLDEEAIVVCTLRLSGSTWCGNFMILLCFIWDYYIAKPWLICWLFRVLILNRL